MRKSLQALIGSGIGRVRKQRDLQTRTAQRLLQNLTVRAKTLEYCSVNCRLCAVEQISVSAQNPSDYCEFGVYKGDTFPHISS